MILWGIVTLPLLIAGFIALAITGLRIRELRHEAQTAHETQPRQPTHAVVKDASARACLPWMSWLQQVPGAWPPRHWS